MNIDQIYQLQENYALNKSTEDEQSLPTRFTNPDSIDNWRHTRMLETINLFVRYSPSSSWLTVGDGNYGSDGSYLQSLGVDVMATSLTVDNLKKGYELGFIKKYQMQNAEKISLEDQSVDFTLCKESYHHFPRPPIALYEMLRVSKEAVILIEPLDNPKILDCLKTMLKKILRGDKVFDFEPSGNYIYKPSVNEISKLSSALFLNTVAIKRFNDFYHPKFSRSSSKIISLDLLITKLGIFIQNILSSLNLLGYGLGVFVIFKGIPSDCLTDELKKNGYKIIKLPKNPFI